jgi:predicted dehydrogenase
MEVLRAGIIGTGFMGGAHAEALRRQPGVEVHAIASREPDRAAILADLCGAPRMYDEWEDLVADDSIQVIHNCTPNDLHFEINRAALEAGKHVISEKPLTVTADEAEVLVRLAAERGVVNAVNFNYRGYPLVQQVRALVENGDLGPVHLVHGHYVQDWLLYREDYNWRVDTTIGGASRAFADIGSHWCDLVQYMSGKRIVRVFADLFRLHETRLMPRLAVETFEAASGENSQEVTVSTEDGANVLLQFEDGARGTVTISQVSAGRKNHLWFEIDASLGAVAWSQERPNELWIGHRDGPNEVLTKDPGLLDARAAAFAHYPGGHPEGYPDGFKNIFQNVYQAVRDGSGSGYATFADGLRAARLVEAVLESHRTQRWVDVDE